MVQDGPWSKRSIFSIPSTVCMMCFWKSLFVLEATFIIANYCIMYLSMRGHLTKQHHPSHSDCNCLLSIGDSTSADQFHYSYIMNNHKYEKRLTEWINEWVNQSYICPNAAFFTCPLSKSTWHQGISATRSIKNLLYSRSIVWLKPMNESTRMSEYRQSHESSTQNEPNFKQQR